MRYDKLSVDELVRYAHLELNALTTTPLEQELVARLEAVAAEAAENADLVGYLRDTDRTVKDALALLKLCDERGAESVKALTDKLDRADRWFDAASEAGDIFARLETLRAATT